MTVDPLWTWPPTIAAAVVIVITTIVYHMTTARTVQHNIVPSPRDPVPSAVSNTNVARPVPSPRDPVASAESNTNVARSVPSPRDPVASAEPNSNVARPGCAKCGKSDDGLKTCNRCKRAKYCSAECQRSDWPSHKVACKKRAIEMQDEALFKQPVVEDCPICFLPIAIGVVDATYQTCCGKTICHGCTYTDEKERKRENLPICCPFCRENNSGHLSNKEAIRRIRNRMNLNDADAFGLFGWWHHNGSYGLKPNEKKAFDLWMTASDLGSPEGHNNVAMAYFEGRGVAQDEKMANEYFKKAAIGGETASRHNLGTFEHRECNNLSRAMRHWMISTGAGFGESFKTIARLFKMGHVSREEFMKALHVFNNATLEIESTQRKEAAAASQGDSYLPPVRYS